jgi:hypothetical protein
MTVCCAVLLTIEIDFLGWVDSTSTIGGHGGGLVRFAGFWKATRGLITWLYEQRIIDILRYVQVKE